MAHTYTNLLVHGIFITKDRLRLIESEMKTELLAIIGGIIRNIKGRAYAINGTADYLHWKSTTARLILKKSSLAFRGNMALSMMNVISGVEGRPSGVRSNF